MEGGSAAKKARCEPDTEGDGEEEWRRVAAEPHFLVLGDEEVEASSVACGGGQGALAEWTLTPGRSVAGARGRVRVGTRVVAELGAMDGPARQHDGWRGHTTKRGEAKLLFDGTGMLVGVRVALHALSYAPGTRLLRGPKETRKEGEKKGEVQHKPFSGWSALVTLRSDGGALLFERFFDRSLRVAEVVSEARALLSLAPRDFDGVTVPRPLSATEPDRLRLLGDWTLWAPSGAMALRQSCYLWTDRHRQFLSLYQAVSLNTEGFGIRFAVHDPSSSSPAAGSKLVSISIDVTLKLLLERLGAPTSKPIKLKDVAPWIASQAAN